MLLRLVVLLALAIAIPVAAMVAGPLLRTRPDPNQLFSGGTSYPDSPQAFAFQPTQEKFAGLPQITNVQIVDFDLDGTNDLLVCDALGSRVLLLQRQADGSWLESTLVADVAAPAHATVVDIDQDNDNDLIVSVLGNIMPDDHVIGRVELFENVDGDFRRHVILDDVRRVADVQWGDFDRDADIDLAVAVFGYSRGSVLWLENQGEFRFRDHELLTGPGTIHVPVGDYDLDGDLDIAAIVTQDEEELWGLENLGDGTFQKRRLWMTINPDLGSAGLVQSDLDQDGDLDLILPAGDNLEDFDAYPQPYHGCYWFENQGDWQFKFHRIADLGGTYAAAVDDMNGDGHLDLVLVSLTNNWLEPNNASIVWLENDGQQNFKTWQIDAAPLHLVTVDTGDLNDDGLPDIAAGSLNVRRPHRNLGRVSTWLNQSGDQP
ncbi:VCBS repeat-containing protein [Bremerella sp. JC770]|uniref:FG-GAP repeat domain-containing protein n=1 Tax=Bremerella sp. JC770 TaxID=3232137 RepID=UPI00345B2C9C